MISTTTTIIAAGAVGLFVVYCVYFDRKRRSDPLYKEKLKKKKREEKSKKQQTASIKLPDLKDLEAMQQFFIEQVQLGEDLLAQGEYENGIEHLCTAVAVCGQPQQLLGVLQQTLPPQMFQLMLHRLPVVSQKIAMSMEQTLDDTAPKAMSEEDVE